LTTDDIEKTNVKTEKDEDSLNGFGNANNTSSQADVEEEEDDKEYDRNLLIKEANKIYSPRQATTGCPMPRETAKENLVVTEVMAKNNYDKTKNKKMGTREA
jgi:hypothetical protein